MNYNDVSFTVLFELYSECCTLQHNLCVALQCSIFGVLHYSLCCGLGVLLYCRIWLGSLVHFSLVCVVQFKEICVVGCVVSFKVVSFVGCLV